MSEAMDLTAGSTFEKSGAKSVATESVASESVATESVEGASSFLNYKIVRQHHNQSQIKVWSVA